MELFRGYNDYELLYMINDGNELAYDLMFKKYRFFILKVISKFKISASMIEEYLQEGYIILNKAVFKYNEKFCKSFTRFFELLLVRHYINLLKRNININYEVFDEEIYFTKENIIEETIIAYQGKIIINNLESEIEKEIYQEYFLNNWSVSYICRKNNYTAEQVYNAIRRIRKKL